METIKLDLIPSGRMPSLHASQYDDGREHGIDLLENGIAYNLDGTETLTINERKGDNCICSLDIENTFAETNHIVFASTLQMCAVWGNNICELVIAKGEKTIGTLNFILAVEQSPTENGIESESEISNLERQIEAITEEVIGDDYYTKTQTDEAIATAIEGKADKTDTYTKTEVNTRLNNKMDKNNPTGTGNISVGSGITMFGYNSQAFGSNHVVGGNDNFVAGVGHNIVYGSNRFVSGSYSNGNVGYDIIEVVGNGTSASNRSNARTLDKNGNETLAGNLTFNGNKSLTSEISRLDGRIDNLPAPMIFKGTLGVGGTIQTLPAASASNEGWTYKVITAGTYAGQTAKVGDTFTSNVSEWVLFSQGDTDTDTWRAIKVNGVEKLGNGISSGAVDFKDTTNVKFGFDAGENAISATLDGIYTASQVDDLLDDKADKSDTYTKEQVDDIVYNILPDDTASGSVANFETDLVLPIKSLGVDVNAVQAAGTPTPATPLPISGWSEISLVHCRRNLCKQTDIVGAYPTRYTIDTDGSIKTVGFLGLSDVLWTNKSKVSGVLNVIFVSKYQNTGSVGIRPKIVYTDGTTSVIYTTNTQDYSVKTLLTNSSKTVEKIVVDYGTNNPTNFFLEVTLDTSASTYEPYNGTTEVINLGGTYYGGHLTQDKAGHRQFEVTHGIKLFGDISFSRSNNQGVWEGYRFYALIDKLRGKDVKCSNYEAFSVNTASVVMNNETLIAPTGNDYIYIRDDAYTTVEDFKEANANTQLVYPLATPYTIDLPDGEPIITLNGTNNIFADSGDCAVEYKVSVKQYVSNHSGGGLGGAKSLGGSLGGDDKDDEEDPKGDEKEVEPISKK